MHRTEWFRATGSGQRGPFKGAVCCECLRAADQEHRSARRTVPSERPHRATHRTHPDAENQKVNNSWDVGIGCASGAVWEGRAQVRVEGWGRGWSPIPTSSGRWRLPLPPEYSDMGSQHLENKDVIRYLLIRLQRAGKDTGEPTCASSSQSRQAAKAANCRIPTI